MRVASAEHKLYDIDTQRVRGRGPREAGAGAAAARRRQELL